MKFLRSLIITAAVLFAIIHFGSNYAVSQVFEKWLGVPVSVSWVRWGFSSHQLVLKNVRIHNPSGYSAQDLARISRIQADYDVSDLRHGLFKIKRLEVKVDEIRLERKSMIESNLMGLQPLNTAINSLSQNIKGKTAMVRFQIEKVRLEIDRVTFQTQLGNDAVTENRKVNAPQEDLSNLNTPDSIAVYTALLALQSAGWQSFLPSQAEVATQIKTQVNDWVEKARQQALILQAQVNQYLNKKLNQPQ